MPGPGGPPTLALTLSRSARDTPRLFHHVHLSTVLPPPRPSSLMTSASSASMTL
ncbi:hypothetical protein EXIGLDRAFT_731553 [Exidia glandulosa HHB12029]|uniref:Uncharacterized protein n=1 Tax=Exidia glandulosa HHB12029 TaxID=1314781 RepID=A0A165BTY8_EXIGL|nr:hypothetical protein EXIGLDRAFT_731553 [Exidia glandulosa HHB12029]